MSGTKPNKKNGVNGNGHTGDDEEGDGLHDDELPQTLLLEDNGQVARLLPLRWKRQKGKESHHPSEQALIQTS